MRIIYQRILFWIVALIILALAWGTVYACESYEECMELTPPMEGTMIVGGVVKHAGKIHHLRPEDHYFVLKAIAYKLDEISNKLYKQDPHHGWLCIDRAPDGFCRKEVRDGSPTHKNYMECLYGCDSVGEETCEEICARTLTHV